VDVQQAFHWLREALLLPLDPGSTVIAMSSGAALHGSPLSGGYAGAKAMVRFLAGYAAGESARSELGIRIVSILPTLTPETDLGAMAVAAYARGKESRWRSNCAGWDRCCVPRTPASTSRRSRSALTTRPARTC